MAPHETGSKYDVALRQLTSFIQIIIYRRENTPIRDRQEVQLDVGLRLAELGKSERNGKKEWRKRLLELAAYAVFAAVSDNSEE